MLYVPLNVGVLNHPKFDTFLEAADLETPAEGIGILSCLWLWATAQEIPEDGTLPDMGQRSRVKMLGCAPEQVDKILEALVNSRFLDLEAGVYRIHDWQNYGGKLMAERSRRAEYARRKREERGRDGNVTVTSPERDVMLPSKGEPSQHKPSQAKVEPIAPTAHDAPTGLEDFFPPMFKNAWEAADKFWAALPPIKVYQSRSAAKSTPGEIREWFAQNPSKWAEGVKIAECLADIHKTRPEWPLSGIPRPLTLLQEQWDRDGLESRCRPLPSNRQVAPAATGTPVSSYQSERQARLAERLKEKGIA